MSARTKPAPTQPPTLTFASPRELDAWLQKHHASSGGFWLKLAKKGSGTPSVTYPEAIEVALRWGWIDGQKKGHDHAWWLQKFTRRGPRSIWSKLNREKAEALIAAGKMEPAGLAEVERARADGRWASAYPGQKSAEVPEDLLAALAKTPRAKEFFETLNSANRYAVLFRLHHAKRPETRARWIARFVEMFERGEKLHP